MIGAWLLAASGALSLVATPPPLAQNAYKIVVNPANPTSSLTRAELSRMFLEPSTWPDGQPVLPVDMTAGSPLRDVFSTTVHGEPAAAVAARITPARRGGKPPMTLSSDPDVIQYVRLKLGAIGYVSADADVSAVKVLSIDWTRSQTDTDDSPERMIRGVLNAYSTAIQRSDLNALKRLWPTITGKQMLAYRAEFAQTRVLRIDMLEPKIDVNGDAAVVTARRRSVVLASSGTTTHVLTTATLRLRHEASGWTIEDVQYQPAR
jgi:hypothetical protein